MVRSKRGEAGDWNGVRAYHRVFLGNPEVTTLAFACRENARLHGARGGRAPLSHKEDNQCNNDCKYDESDDNACHASTADGAGARTSGKSCK